MTYFYLRQVLPLEQRKDLDLVLCVEALTPEFVNHFWVFVKEGGYQIRERSNGDKCFYRFTRPTNDGYPKMLEILSRTPNILGDRPDGAIAPLAVDEEIVSLSAILLNEEYYNYIKALKLR